MNARDDHGFTLVEALIGLALLALLTVLLTTAVSGLRQTQRAQDRLTIAADVEPVEAYLRRTLVAMQPLRVSASAGAAPLIDARADRLTFITSHSPAGNYAGLHVVAWRFVPSERAGLLDLEEVRALHRPGQPKQGEIKTRLLAGLASGAFRYYGTGPRADAWTTTWTGTLQPPKLVALDIMVAASDPRRFGALLVAVPAGQ